MCRLYGNMHERITSQFAFGVDSRFFWKAVTHAPNLDVTEFTAFTALIKLCKFEGARALSALPFSFYRDKLSVRNRRFLDRDAFVISYSSRRSINYPVLAYTIELPS